MTKMQFVEQAVAKIEETATPRQKEATKLLVEALWVTCRLRFVLWKESPLRTFRPF